MVHHPLLKPDETSYSIDLRMEVASLEIEPNKSPGIAEREGNCSFGGNIKKEELYGGQ